MSRPSVVTVVSFPVLLVVTDIPVEAHAEMGRKEEDYVWKKDTDNIQNVFELMEELGS